jgi:hypothetical protein
LFDKSARFRIKVVMKSLKSLLVFGSLAAACLILGQFQIFASDNGGAIISPEPPIPLPPTNSLPTVSIVATDAEASEVPVNGVTNTATFTISRTGSTDAALSVFLNLGGTATFGVDYTAAPLLFPPQPASAGAAIVLPPVIGPEIVLPAGASNVQLTIWPINDDGAHPDVRRTGAESVVANLVQPIEIFPLAVFSPTNSTPPIVLTYNIDPGAHTATALILDNDPSTTNHPPFVELVSPGPDATLVVPTNVTINALAYDRDGTVQSVEFFVNSNSLGVVTGPVSNSVPTATAIATAISSFIYSTTWNATNAGTYTLTAKATDNSGATSVSDPVVVKVRAAPTNLPPVVAITSPDPNAGFTYPTNVVITASITDNSANLRYVEFFANDQLISVQPRSTNTVYSFTWANPDPGSYNLTVAAWDYLRASAVSTPVPITVNPPTAAPAGQLLNLNFGGGNKTGFAAAGLSTNDVWNVINGTSVTWSNLVMAPSNSSPITVELDNAGGQGANNSGDAMYDSYVFPKNNTAISRPISVTLQNVPFGKYDVYLYGHADALPGLENDSVFQLTSGGQNFGPLGTISSSGWQATDPWQEGIQYIAFRDVMVGLDGAMQIQVLAGLNGQTTTDPRHAAVLNGLQLLSKDPTASNAPPTISLVAPTNGSVFPALTSLVLTADAEDTDGVVSRVDFFEGTSWLGGKKLIGSVNGSSSSNLISITWSNVLSGRYTITARATDDGGKTAVSAPIKITVSETNSLPVVNVVATDRYAVEPSSNAVVNTGTFTVSRNGDLANPLTVFYGVSGTASNGVDYVSLPGSVTIPAGTNVVAITVTPLADNDTNDFGTVILTLVPSPVASPAATYSVGNHFRDVVYILDGVVIDPPLPPGSSSNGGVPESVGALPKTFAATVDGDGSGHLSVGGNNGDLVVVEVSSDLSNWTYLTHGFIVDGGFEIVDPNATGDRGRFYRSVRP